LLGAIKGYKADEMIYAQIHNYRDINGDARQTVASRADQPDTTWEPYDVPDASWLSIDHGKIVQATTAPIPPEPVITQQPYHPLLKFQLQTKAVLVDCLNEAKEHICSASGFICKEGSEYFLYTCWHVATGYNMHHLRTVAPPDRRFIRVQFQEVTRPSENTTVLGGVQELIVPLYDMKHEIPQPLWVQQREEKPDISLNSLNMHVPEYLDAIKIKLPDDINIFDEQVIDRTTLCHGMPEIGETLYIVGYPFGFSATGESQPTPIVLSRFVASTVSTHRPGQILLDGAGVPGMSGGPVFSELPGLGLMFLGIYTGEIWPDCATGGSTRSLPLGTCCSLWTFEDDNLRKARYAHFFGK
jgi:hypothetical protein